MEVGRSQLTVLLNALFDTDTTRIAVSHPSEDVGELFEMDLEDGGMATIRLSKSVDEYAEVRRSVETTHGAPAVTELPEPRSYTNAFLAGGLVQPKNAAEIDAFLDRYGQPDLTAGHKPVVAGFDTNLLPWRIAEVLDLHPGHDAVVNGYVLATGVRDELDWEQKRSNTRPVERAFGGEFAELWNQPAGARREGRLGENYYRLLRDHRYAEEVRTDRGDEAIIAGYDAVQDDRRKDVLLFSNDRDFVERARSHRILAQRIEFPDRIPAEIEAPWSAIQDTLYVLGVLFGVLRLPKVTVYGVWNGKGGRAWQRERLELDCRSPTVRTLIERDLAILSSLPE